MIILLFIAAKGWKPALNFWIGWESEGSRSSHSKPPPRPTYNSPADHEAYLGQLHEIMRDFRAENSTFSKAYEHHTDQLDPQTASYAIGVVDYANLYRNHISQNYDFQRRVLHLHVPDRYQFSHNILLDSLLRINENNMRARQAVVAEDWPLLDELRVNDQEAVQTLITNYEGSS